MEVNSLVNDINNFSYSFKERYLNRLTPTQQTVVTIALFIFSTFLVCHVATLLKNLLSKSILPIDHEEADFSDHTPRGPLDSNSEDETNLETETPLEPQENRNGEMVNPKITQKEIPYITKEEYFKWAEETCKLIYQQPNLGEDEKAAQYDQYIEVLDWLRPNPNLNLQECSENMEDWRGKFSLILKKNLYMPFLPIEVCYKLSDKFRQIFMALREEISDQEYKRLLNSYQ